MSTPVVGPIPQIGQIKGRIHWQKGQLPSITVGSLGVEGRIGSVSDVIKIQPFQVKGGGILPELSPIKGSSTIFGEVSAVGGGLSVPYTASELPLDTEILLAITAKGAEGPIAPLTTAILSLDLENPVISGVDFAYVRISVPPSW